MKRIFIKWKNNLIVTVVLLTSVLACTQTAISQTCTCDTFAIAEAIGYRHPSCTGDYQNYIRWGYNMGESTTSTITCGGTVVTNDANGYDLYFYNEQAYTSCGAASSSGRPILFANSSKIKIDSVGQGLATFYSYKCACSTPTVTGEDAVVYTMNPNLVASRCIGTYKLLQSTVVTITTNCVIGNRFQNSSDDQAPTGQNVYLVKKSVPSGYDYYVFMVYQFKIPGNAQYMKLYSRKLGTDN
jgi:hypothetical protein